MKIIKGDNVVVLAGKDKGAEGVVQKAMPETGKVVIEGVAKKHQAPTRADQQDGIIDKPIPSAPQRRRDQPEGRQGHRVGYKVPTTGRRSVSASAPVRRSSTTTITALRTGTATRSGPSSRTSGTRQHLCWCQDREDRAQHGRR